MKRAGGRKKFRRWWRQPRLPCFLEQSPKIQICNRLQVSVSLGASHEVVSCALFKLKNDGQARAGKIAVSSRQRHRATITHKKIPFQTRDIFFFDGAIIWICAKFTDLKSRKPFAYRNHLAYSRRYRRFSPNRKNPCSTPAPDMRRARADCTH